MMMRSSSYFRIVALLFVLAASASRAAAQAPIDIGSRLELFVDRYLIDRTDHVELKLREPIEQPMAKSPLPLRHMITIIKDGELYRAWYRDTDKSYPTPLHTGHEAYHTRYAESKDGREWTFPKLGLFEVEGSTDNNAVMAKNAPFGENFAPFLDTRPDVDPKQRYKAIAGYPGPGNKSETGAPGKGLYGFVSPDGIHWTKTNEIIPYRKGWRHAMDSQNVGFWSEAEGQYVCYFRTWTEPDRLRSVSRSMSKDFVTWTDPVEMKPNLPGEHLYTTQTHPYFRAPHIYVALPTRFVPGRVPTEAEGALGETKEPNITDILFMTSRAGSTHYDRPFTQAFIRPGLDPARWTNRANYAALNVVPISPTQMMIHHRSGADYFLRIDGFVSATADAQPGELVTKPLTFKGGTLTLNLSTTARGSAQVEVQDADGKPIDGFALDDCVPLIGDTIAMDVKWKGNPSLSSLAGKPVRLRFVMKECDLYSLKFQ
jgi:hypothetical protein